MHSHSCIHRCCALLLTLPPPPPPPPPCITLSLSYSPYHRRAHSRRAVQDGEDGAKSEGEKTASCYIVELPELPGKLDMAKAQKLGVPKVRNPSVKALASKFLDLF